MVSGILELAEELMVAIVEQIDDLETLRSLAQTCSRLQNLAEPKIYHHVFLRSRHDAARLARSIVSRYERLREIRSIDARLAYFPDDCRLDSLVDIVRQASNLRQLTVESPYCNHIRESTEHGWDASMYKLLRPVFDLSLSRLRSLTLHLSLENERYWTIDERSFTIFSHPTLTSLKVSCARLPNNLSSLLRDRPRTPLRRLIFIECNFENIEALASVLAAPSALEHLSLGEDCEHGAHGDSDPGGCQLYADELPVFLAALGQQRHSLKSFGYASTPTVYRGLPAQGITMDPPTTLPPCDGLSPFHQLTEISLFDLSLELDGLFSSRQMAPPMLQSLILHERTWRHIPREDAAGQAGLSWIADVAATAQSLRTVILIVERVASKNIMCEPLEALQEVLRGREISVQVWKRSTFGKMPPYLHGETPHCDEEMARYENSQVRWIDSFKRRQMHDRCLIFG